MSADYWTTVPGKLRAEGFYVVFERISYEPTRSQWRATASRDGRQWTAYADDLKSVYLELERLTREPGEAEEWPTISIRKDPRRAPGRATAGSGA